MASNPLDENDLEREQRIRDRAYQLWQNDGEPEGQDVEYWERARELVGMMENPQAGQMPNPLAQGDTAPVEFEEAALQDNLGEFPGRQADQGEKLQAPMTKRKARTEKA